MTGPTLAGAALQTFTGLAVVVVAIIAIGIALRHLAPGRLVRGSLMKTVAALPLGTRERVVVVELGEQWLVLGVTANQVNLLHVTAKGELPSPTVRADKAAFAAWLERARRGRG